MSALGAPRAKLIVSAAIARQYRNGYPAARPGRYFSGMPASLELVKIALQAYGSGDVEIALALSDPTDPLGRARLPARRRARLGPRRRGPRDAPLPRRLGELQLRARGHRRGRPGKVVGICRERGVDREGVPVDRRFGGLWVIEGGQDRLLVHLPDPEGGGPRRPGAGRQRAPASQAEAGSAARPRPAGPASDPAPAQPQPGSGPDRGAAPRGEGPRAACSARRPAS